MPLTNRSLSSFQFTANDIKSIINKLDPNKALGHDMISICMIKLCCDSIDKPLEIMLKACSNQGIFFSRMEKGKCSVSAYERESSMCENLQIGFSSTSA